MKKYCVIRILTKLLKWFAALEFIGSVWLFFSVDGWVGYFAKSTAIPLFLGALGTLAFSEFLEILVSIEQSARKIAINTDDLLDRLNKK
jgi:hypothetical protein